MSSAAFEHEYKERIKEIKWKMKARGARASLELRNAAILTLRGQGKGRVYRVPGTRRKYTASAPGDVPAVRTGTYRMAWKPRSMITENTVTARIENPTKVGRYVLGELLEDGTSKMDSRPHLEKIKEKARPKIERIFNEPYF